MGGHGCHSATERMKELAAEKAADCSTSAFSEGNRRPIATLWATALQLSLDRSGYLFQHANKTGVAYPTANHWQYAHSPPHHPLSCISGQLISTPLSTFFHFLFSGTALSSIFLRAIFRYLPSLTPSPS